MGIQQWVKRLNRRRLQQDMVYDRLIDALVFCVRSLDDDFAASPATNKGQEKFREKFLRTLDTYRSRLNERASSGLCTMDTKEAASVDAFYSLCKRLETLIHDDEYRPLS